MSDPSSVEHWRGQIRAAESLRERGRAMVASAEKTIEQAKQRIVAMGGRP